MTDYHILRNKRFVLTNSTSGVAGSAEVQLWSVETGKVVKSYKSKTF